MYLADTNVFLEILLAQDNSDKCRTFLEGNWAETFVSDFSLHSIGVILFKAGRGDLFGVSATRCCRVLRFCLCHERPMARCLG